MKTKSGEDNNLYSQCVYYLFLHNFAQIKLIVDYF